MGKRGFTLLEVMVSLAIAGGLLVTLIYTLNYHMGVALRHETLTVGHMLGMEKLAELKEDPKEASGQFPEPYSDYAYRGGVKPSSYPGISEVSVVVERDGERILLRELIRSGS
jgi:general secretion pathway protein I